MKLSIISKYWLVFSLLVVAVGCSNAQPQIRIVKPDNNGRFLIEYKKDIEGDEELYLVAENGYDQFFENTVKFVPLNDALETIKELTIESDIEFIHFYIDNANKTKNYSTILKFPNTFYPVTSYFNFEINGSLHYMNIPKPNSADSIIVYFDPGFLKYSIQKENDKVELLINKTKWQIPIQNDTIRITNPIKDLDSVSLEEVIKNKISKILIGKIEFTSTFKKLVDTIIVKELETDEGNYTLSFNDGAPYVINSGDKLIIQPESSSFISIHLNLADVIKKEISSSNIDTDTLIIKYEIPDFEFQVSDGIYLDKTYSVKGNEGQLVIINTKDFDLFALIADLYDKVPQWVLYGVLALVLMFLLLFRKKLANLFKRISIVRRDEPGEVEIVGHNKMYNETDTFKGKIQEISIFINNQEDSNKISKLLDEIQTADTDLRNETHDFKAQITIFEQNLIIVQDKLSKLESDKKELENKILRIENKTASDKLEIDRLSEELQTVNQRIKTIEDEYRKQLIEKDKKHSAEISGKNEEIKSLESYLKERLPYYYTDVIATLESIISFYRKMQSTTNSSGSNVYKELIVPVLGDGINDDGLLSTLKRLSDLETLKTKIPAFNDLLKLKADDDKVKKELLKLLIGNPQKSFINTIAISYAYLNSRESHITKVLQEQDIDEELIRTAYALLTNCLSKNFKMNLVSPKLFTDTYNETLHIIDRDGNVKLLQHVSNNDVHKSIEKLKIDTIYDIVFIGYKGELSDGFNSKPVVVTK